MYDVDDIFQIEDPADKLEAIKDLMKELVCEAADTVRATDERDRAESYWIAHIRCALDDDHNYVDRSTTMQDTIDALRDEDEDEEDVG